MLNINYFSIILILSIMIIGIYFAIRSGIRLIDKG